MLSGIHLKLKTNLTDSIIVFHILYKKNHDNIVIVNSFGHNNTKQSENLTTVLSV